MVLAGMFLSGISGPTVADISAMAAMVLPAMERAGYRRSRSLAVVSAASALGHQAQADRARPLERISASQTAT